MMMRCSGLHFVANLKLLVLGLEVLIYSMPNLKKNLVLTVLLLALITSIFAYSGVAQNTLVDAVIIIHAKGSFKDRGNKQWLESGISGKSQFNFMETNRTASAVFLLDSSRNVRLELNISENMIYYSDTKTTRAALYPIVNYQRGANGNYYRIRSSQKCLQAVELEGGVFSAELMNCSSSASQQWNIVEHNNVGVTTYRMRNLLTQIRQKNLCLSGAAVRAIVTMNECDTTDAQRWVNLKLNSPSTSFSNIRTLAVTDSQCLGIQNSTDGAPRFRQDEDGILLRDTEFSRLRIAFCDERNDSGNDNNPRWAIQPL
jgi:hypothetical protein